MKNIQIIARTNAREAADKVRGHSGYVGGDTPDEPIFGWNTSPGSFYGHHGYSTYVLMPDSNNIRGYSGKNEHVQAFPSVEEARAYAINLYEQYKSTGQIPHADPLEWL